MSRPTKQTDSALNALIKKDNDAIQKKEASKVVLKKKMEYEKNKEGQAVNHLYKQINEIEKEIENTRKPFELKRKKLQLNVDKINNEILAIYKSIGSKRNILDSRHITKIGEIKTERDFVAFIKREMKLAKDITRETMIDFDEKDDTRMTPRWETFHKEVDKRTKEIHEKSWFKWNIQIVAKRLNNNIQLVRVFDSWYEGKASDSEWIKYFAFYGTKLVGYHFTRKAEHAGDEGIRNAWIMKKDLHSGDDEYKTNQYECSYRSRWGSLGNRPANFSDWKKALQDFPEKLLVKFPGINLSSKYNCNRIIKIVWF